VAIDNLSINRQPAAFSASTFIPDQPLIGATRWTGVLSGASPEWRTRCLVTRAMKTTISALLASLSMAAWVSAQETLTLGDAVRFGLEHNLTVANQSLQIDKADEDLQTARSRRLPQFKVETQASQLLRPVDLTFPRGAFGTFEGIGPVPATDAAV